MKAEITIYGMIKLVLRFAFGKLLNQFSKKSFCNVFTELSGTFSEKC